MQTEQMTADCTSDAQFVQKRVDDENENGSYLVLELALKVAFPFLDVPHTAAASAAAAVWAAAAAKRAAATTPTPSSYHYSGEYASAESSSAEAALAIVVSSARFASFPVPPIDAAKIFQVIS